MSGFVSDLAGIYILNYHNLFDTVDSDTFERMKIEESKEGQGGREVWSVFKNMVRIKKIKRD